MPAAKGRPTVYTDKTASVTTKVDEALYVELSRLAREYGLSVPLYVGMMLNVHVRGVRADERRAAMEAASV